MPLRSAPTVDGALYVDRKADQQGSVLGPLLFVLQAYTAELFDVIASSGLAGHSYAVYISAPAESADIAVDRFISFVERIEAWMSSNRLKLNADKTHNNCARSDQCSRRRLQGGPKKTKLSYFVHVFVKY